MKEYHLHKYDYTKVQLDIHDARPYCIKNEEHCYKPHRHSYYQIIWFSEEGEHYVDYQRFNHQRNTVFFLAKGQVHSFCKTSINEGILFHFNEEFLSGSDPITSQVMKYRLFSNIGLPFLVLNDDEIITFQHVTKNLLQELEEKKYNYKQQLYFYFQILLLKLERQIQLDTTELEVDAAFEMAMLFKEEVENNLDRFNPISFYAEKLNTTEKKLTKVSKKFLHQTPSQYINDKKILEAKRLLSNSNLLIKEIAYNLGFDQSTYFTKYFKKHSGITPKEFKEEYL